MSNNQRNVRTEGSIIGFLMGQLAAAFFAIPTAALIWLATNKHLAIWGTTDVFVDSTGFWLVLGLFAFISAFLPNLFPSLLGKVWHGLIRFEQWF